MCCPILIKICKIVSIVALNVYCFNNRYIPWTGWTLKMSPVYRCAKCVFLPPVVRSSATYRILTDNIRACFQKYFSNDKLFCKPVYVWLINNINVLQLWLNILMETFYSNEHNSNINFPSPGGSCKGIINPFYDIISSKCKAATLP